ncbi:protein VACUOLELESS GAMETOPHYTES-like [Phragmites australis]|uniref:protein VACUOLELESS GAMETOPHYTES-like n=1 Tax=Phragmites australis TaxID=29695 RepID=UPI002D782C8F|nr:protein VACUOLELESS GAMETOPHYTES-like [Phragmites australis]
MGAAMSGHFSHPDHHAPFKRVHDDFTNSRCGMCQLKFVFGAAAYRCSEPGCPFLLHDACYRRPVTIRRHFGHPQHRLALGLTPTSRSDRRPCSLCAQGLDAPAFAYSCTDRGCVAGGFRAHPRCCNLPRDISTPLHSHRRLVLRPPSGGNNSNGQQHPRSCVKCRKTTTGRTAAWSYQCPKCDDVELCLACLLGKDGRDVVLVAVHYLGRVAGALFCGFVSGMGCPGFTIQSYPGDMEITRYQK